MLQSAVGRCHSCYQRNIQGGFSVLPRAKANCVLGMRGVGLTMGSQSVFLALKMYFLSFQVTEKGSGLRMFILTLNLPK